MLAGSARLPLSAFRFPLSAFHCTLYAVRETGHHRDTTLLSTEPEHALYQ